MENVLKEINRFALPGLLVILGIIVLIIGRDQLFGYVIGGIGLVLVGILSVIYTLGWINRMAHLILVGLLFLGSVFFLWKDYRSVADVTEFHEAVAQRLKIVKQRLYDIRDAQVGFRKQYGHFTNDFDSLVNFVKSDSVMDVYKKGNLAVATPENTALLGLDLFEILSSGDNKLTHEQMLALDSLDPNVTYIRDTFYHKAFDFCYQVGDSAWEANRTLPLNVDSMRYVPYGDTPQEFLLEAGYIDRGNQRVPVFSATDPDPIDKKNDPWQIGSMTEPSVTGNWTDKDN